MSSLPDGWVETSLGDMGKAVTGKTPSKNNLEHWGDILDFITPTDFKGDGKFLSQVDRKLSDEGRTAFKRLVIPSKSVVVTCIGSDMGKVAINKNDCVTNQQINSLIINQDKYNADFIHYLLKASYKVLRLYADGGSTMPIINKSTFESLTFEIPPLPEQKAIADMLSSFDEKIALLREQNNTLETLAQTIFKEWFVNFNYPDATGEMVDSELGEIPKGWRVGSFDEVVEFSNGYAFKAKELIKEPTNNSFAVFKMGHIKKGGGFNPAKTKDYVEKEKCSKLSRFVLKKGDILMCMTDMKDSTSLLGHTALMFDTEAYIVNQRVGLIRARNEVNIDYPWLYMLTNSMEFISDLRKRANSGVQVNLSTSEIKDSKIIIPNKQINTDFDEQAKPIFEKIQNNEVQIQSLSKTRDALLPKLMSGSIRIGE